MDTEQFLAQVLPSTGYRFLVFIFPDGKVWSKHLPPGTDEIAGLAQWGVARGADVYFAVGGYEAGPDGQFSRTAERAALHRSLRVDVDCGDGKPYPDKHSGLGALLGASDSLRLPRPTLVDSGYGLHAYWPFDTDLPLAHWLRLSRRLQGALTQAGLQVDTTTTCDAARILRLPGTVNFKRGAQAPVRLLALGAPTGPLGLTAALAPYPDAAASAPRIPVTGVNAALIAGADYPPYALRGVLTDCPGFAAMLSSHGATAREPLWKATLDMVAASSEAPDVKERVARALSDGHPGFTEEDFSRKWAQAQAQQYQPATCSKLSQLGMPQCNGCPHAGKIASPVVLGRPRAAVAPTPLPVPELAGALQYGGMVVTPGESAVRIVDGKIGTIEVRGGIPHVMRKDGEDGQGNVIWRAIPIGAFPVRRLELLADRTGRGTFVMLTFDRFADGPITVELGPTEQTETKACARALAAANIRMRGEHVNIFRDTIMVEFLSHLQRIRRSGQIASRCGWTAEFKEFVLGTWIYSDGRDPEPVRAAGVVEAIEPYKIAGDPALWRQAFDLTLTGGGERQAVLALALAAPLLAFSGIDGVMLNAFSPESGIGKSTLCEAALSLWGNPGELRRDAKDTVNATFKLAAATGNLPYVVDEFTNIEGRALSDFVYTLTQGRERHRLGADARLQANPNRWCLPVIVTANNSVHDKLMQYKPDVAAETARVFDMRLGPLDLTPAQLSAAKAVLVHLRHNYGFFGPQLAQLFVSKPASAWRALVQRRIAEWDTRMNAGSSDRFRSALCAIAQIGSELGKILGLAFDPAAVVEALQQHWMRQDKFMEDNVVKTDDILQDYLIHHLAEFNVYGGDRGDRLLRENGRQLYGEIRSVSEKGRNRVVSVFIPTSQLRKHAAERNFNWAAISESISTGSLSAHVLSRGQMYAGHGTVLQCRCTGIKFGPSVLGAMGFEVVAADGGIHAKYPKVQ